MQTKASRQNTARNAVKNAALALGALALLGGPQAVRAQDAATTAADTGKPITLNLINVPVQASLRTLFNSAGIRNYIIDSDVQGFANINVSEVPFSLALRQMLSSVNPPLTFDIENGAYHVKVQRATPPPAPTIVPPSTTVADGGTTESTADQPKRFYRIPIDKYDAFYIASLLGATGIVRVGVNDVIPAGGGQTGGNNGGGQGGFGGGFGGGSQGGFGGGGFGGGPNVSTVGGGGFGGGNSFGGGGGGFGGGGGGFGGGRRY